MLKGQVEEIGDRGDVTKAIFTIKDGWGIIKFELREEGTPFGEDGKVCEAKWTCDGKVGDRKVWVNGMYGTMSLISQALGGSKAKGKAKPGKAPPADG